MDDFTLGKGAIVNGLDAADNGVVFTAGAYNDLTGVTHAIVQRSLDGGGTWNTVLDQPGATARAWSVRVGGSGLVFATATLRSTRNSAWNDWATFRSTDGGTTWSRVDTLTAPNFKANPNAVVEDSAGRVFVGGNYGDSKNADHFLTRRSLDGGTSWTTVDDQAPGGFNVVTSLAATPSGVFAAGHLRNVWTVRRSVNGGATWATVDSFLAAPAGSWSHASGIAADANGNLYVTGQSQFRVHKVTDLHWITRKSTDNGATWSTVDDVVLGTNPYGRSVTVDALGHLFASGYYTSGSAYHWVTRTSVDAGVTWVTSDDLIGIGYAAASDAVGNTFTGGQTSQTDGTHGIVRKLAAQ